MRRWIFDAAAGMSLVLLLGAVGLWVESYTYCRSVRYNWAYRKAGIVSDSGEVQLYRIEWNNPSEWLLVDRYLWGFRFNCTIVTGSHTLYIFGVPHWFLSLVFAVLPALWVRRWRNRIPPGHCKRCGYDLRASEGRCPECGTAIPATTDRPTATPPA